MDYFKEAFGGFSPQSDKDAALKFSLDVLLADHRTNDLTRLVTQHGNLGGIEGEPGWIIECRDLGDMVGYEQWPSSACYRAYVQPDSYALAYPEFFCDKPTFLKYVQSIANAYVGRFPDKQTQVAGLMEALRGQV